MSEETKRTLIVSIAVTICVLAVMAFATITIVQYNQTEQARSVACTDKGGHYRDGGCELP